MVLYPKMIMEALATVMYAGTKKRLRKRLSNTTVAPMCR